MSDRAARWTVVFNRNRDDYQVAVALEEAGLLDSLVTDFYAPEPFPWWLPARLRGLRHPALPATKVNWAPLAFLGQVLGLALKIPMKYVFPVTDYWLARAAARRARRRRTNLLCYANYVPDRDWLQPGARLVDFEFHPNPADTIDLLERDAARFPHVAVSIDAERGDLERKRMLNAWRSADLVLCASSMTRRSLERSGCPAERIRVVPYGCSPRDAPVAPREAGPCRFLFVGQGIQRKGLHHLLEAWGQLAGADATLTLVCYHIDPGIAAAADQPGVTLLGRQSAKELHAIYDGADVFVMPSIIEGFGLVYLEALVAGCHVIGTPNTGLPDLPFSDAAISLVDVGDINALVEAMRGLVQRKRERMLDPQRIADETRRWTWREFRQKVAATIAEVGEGHPSRADAG